MSVGSHCDSTAKEENVLWLTVRSLSTSQTEEPGETRPRLEDRKEQAPAVLGQSGSPAYSMLPLPFKDCPPFPDPQVLLWECALLTLSPLKPAKSKSRLTIVWWQESPPSPKQPEGWPVLQDAAMTGSSEQRHISSSL